MKTIGGYIRYILNINTIWGIMIIVGFLACVMQQVIPMQTTLPASGVKEGENNLLFSWKDKDGKWHEYPIRLLNQNGTMSLVEVQGEDNQLRVHEVAKGEAGYVVKWKYGQSGSYKMQFNGQEIKDKNFRSSEIRNVQTFTDAVFDYAKTGFGIAFDLVAVMVVFLGLMKVGEEAGIVQFVAKVFHPAIRFLFPQVPANHPANGAILMNITTSILGLGNAATPFGLKAMKELQELNPNKEVASDSQIMFLGLNTAGFSIIPTTLIAVRKAAGCKDPLEILGTCMVAGVAATVVAVTAVKVLNKLPIFSVANAVREQEAENKTDEKKEGN